MTTERKRYCAAHGEYGDYTMCPSCWAEAVKTPTPRPAAPSGLTRYTGTIEIPPDTASQNPTVLCAKVDLAADIDAELARLRERVERLEAAPRVVVDNESQRAFIEVSGFRLWLTDGQNQLFSAALKARPGERT